MKQTTLEEAVTATSSGDRVFVHTAAAAPQHLIDAMTARADALESVNVLHLHTEGEAPYTQPKYADTFHTSALFVEANVRTAVNQGGPADYIPVFLSEAPSLFRKGVLPLDVAMIQVSPPDRHGFCSLGVSVDCSHAAVETADCVIAQINPQMPRTHGDGLIHTDSIDMAVEVNTPLPEVPRPQLSNVERAISTHCAKLIDNGATLQVGIGAIPDAALTALESHRDLGVHTEMFSNSVIDLIESGVITGAKKTKKKTHPGKVVGSFAMGTRRLYDFIDDNPQVVMLDAAYVNSTAVIQRNAKVTAINGDCDQQRHRGRPDGPGVC